jgi:voltage-gated potassium channel
LFAASVLGHHWLTDRPFLDSVYWTVVTISTVGYSHEPPDNVGGLEKLFTVGVIIVGTVSVAYLLGVLLQVAVEGQIQTAMGVRRMTNQIAKLRNHVIICGYGRMGTHLAERLAQHATDLVVIDRDPEPVENAKEAGHLVLEGDATSEEILREAGIQYARSLIVALHGDADNVFLTLTARNMSPDLHILARGEQPATEKKLRQAGANQVVLPAVIGAQQMADIILRPHAANLIYGVSGASIDATMEELTIALGSALDGKTIRDAETRQKHRVLIVAVRRAEGELIFNPDADLDFRAGDTLVIIGQNNDVREFRKMFGIAR